MISAGFDSWKALGKEDHHGHRHGSQNAELIPKFRNGVPIHGAEINGRPCRLGKPSHDRNRPNAVPAPDAAEAEDVHDPAGGVEPDARFVRERRQRRVGPRPGCALPDISGSKVLRIGKRLPKGLFEEFEPKVPVTAHRKIPPQNSSLSVRLPRRGVQTSLPFSTRFLKHISAKSPLDSVNLPDLDEVSPPNDQASPISFTDPETL